MGFGPYFLNLGSYYRSAMVDDGYLSDVDHKRFEDFSLFNLDLAFSKVIIFTYCPNYLIVFLLLYDLQEYF